jgi:hypothetical protein
MSQEVIDGLTREQWNEIYRRYPRDVVDHLLANDDLLSLWAAQVIENLREEIKTSGAENQARSQKE